VDHLDHWTNTHKAIPITCSTIQWQNETNDKNNLATTARKMKCHQHMVHLDKPTGYPKHPPTLLTSKWHMTPPTLQKTTKDNTTTDTTNTEQQSTQSTTTGATPTSDKTHSDEQHGNQPAPAMTNLTNEQ
jgi:hypothetical protein